MRAHCGLCVRAKCKRKRLGSLKGGPEGGRAKSGVRETILATSREKRSLFDEAGRKASEEVDQSSSIHLSRANARDICRVQGGEWAG